MLSKWVMGDECKKAEWHANANFETFFYPHPNPGP